MRKLFLIFILILGFVRIGLANETIKLDKKAWEKSKDGYVFKKYKEKKRVEKKEFKEVPKTDFTISPVLKWVAIIAVILLLSFLLYKLVGVPYFRNRKNGKVKNLDVELEDLTKEEFLKTKFETLVEKALQAQDYRLAMRYQFLDTLQKMQENRWIVWGKEKTNHDYLFYTMGEDFYQKFSQLVHLFDLVWYGERVLKEDTFVLLRNEYLNFNKRITGK